MIDIFKEDFDTETGVLNTMMTVYCRPRSELNKHILYYINEKDYSVFDYVYNKSLGSNININGRYNNGSYLIKITIQYIKKK